MAIASRFAGSQAHLQPTQDKCCRLLPSFPEELSEKAARSRAKLGVQVKTGLFVKDVDKEGVIVGVTVQTHDGIDRLNARTVIWAGGVTVCPLGKVLAKRTKAETDKLGRITVSPQLNIAGYPDIYVIGDLALSVDAGGNPLPGVAQVAMQQGTYAAKAIVRKVESKPKQKDFKYFDKGNLAVIGRWAAVANVFGVRLSGFPAWLVWAFIHLMYIVQFQSRILVFIQWAIQDLTFSRGARLITGTAATDFNFNKEIASVEKKPVENEKLVANL